jgi:hypothetical protein
MYIIIKDLSFIGIIVSVLALASSCKKEKSVFAVADFTYSGRTDTVPTTIQFINKSYGLTYSWDFGDGSSSTDKNPNHTFNQVGTYNVKLIAKGTNNSDTMEIVIGIGDIIPRDGLVGWWPFNGNADDESGNGNHGTVNGGQYTSDRNGLTNSALLFNSSSTGFVDINLLSEINGQFSIMFWVRPDRAPTLINESETCPGGVEWLPMANSNQNYVLIPNWYSSSLGVGLTASQNGIMVVEHSSNILVSRISHSLNFIDFNNITIVYKNDSVFLYINGNLIISKNQYCNSSSKNLGSILRFGGSLYSQNFDGAIDDIGIWNRALTQQEITSLYNRGT